MKMINLLNFEKLCTVLCTEMKNPRPAWVLSFTCGVGRKGTTLFADNLNHFLSSSETIMNKEFQRFLFAEKWFFSAA